MTATEHVREAARAEALRRWPYLRTRTHGTAYLMVHGQKRAEKREAFTDGYEAGWLALAEQVRHILGSGYGSLTDAENDLRAAVGLPALGPRHIRGPW